MPKSKMTQADPKNAFDYAIQQGLLTTNETDSNFAGNYMYMYNQDNKSFFKNIITRKYISV